MKLLGDRTSQLSKFLCHIDVSEKFKSIKFSPRLALDVVWQLYNSIHSLHCSTMRSRNRTAIITWLYRHYHVIIASLSCDYDVMNTWFMRRDHEIIASWSRDYCVMITWLLRHDHLINASWSRDYDVIITWLMRYVHVIVITATRDHRACAHPHPSLRRTIFTFIRTVFTTFHSFKVVICFVKL